VSGFVSLRPRAVILGIIIGLIAWGNAMTKAHAMA